MEISSSVIVSTIVLVPRCFLITKVGKNIVGGRRFCICVAVLDFGYSYLFIGIYEKLCDFVPSPASMLATKDPSEFFR
jgi:hypothetical protein